MGFGELPYSVTPELLQLLAPVKSIAQRSRRSQRGIWGDGRAGFGWSSSLLGGKLAFRESIAQRSRRPQRGILGAMVRAGLGGRRRFWAGNTRFGESIAQRSREEDSPQRIFGAASSSRKIGNYNFR